MWVSALAGLAASAALSAGVYQWESHAAAERAELGFYAFARDRLDAMRREVERTLEVIGSVQSLFHASQRVTQEEFSRFAAPLLEKHPGLRAVAWAAVRDGSGAAPEEPMGPLPLRLVESRRGDAELVGLDLGAEPELRSALRQARDTGRFVATGKGALGRLAGESAIAVLAPLYRAESSPRSVFRRRATFQGVVVGVVSAGELFDAALERLAARGIDVRVHDSTAPPGGDRLHTRWSPDVPGERSGLGEPTVEELVPVGGRAWAMAAAPAPGRFRAQPGHTHWATLAGGLALTALLVVYLSAITRQERQLQLRDRAIGSTRDGVFITEAKGPDYPMVYVNAAFTRITGYEPEVVLGQGPALLYGDDQDQPGIEEIRAAVRQRREGSALMRSYRKDARLFWNEFHVAPVRDEQGEVTHFVGVINDVTDEVRYREELEHQANHDSLTGLANRNLLQDRLDQALAHAARNESMTGVVAIDLDRLKKVNDSLGHDAGDRLLQTVAERLRACTRAGDTAARQGGDEFVLVLPYVRNVNEIIAAVNRVHEAIRQPLYLDGHDVIVTASFGISVYPKDGQNPDTLVRNADAAMHRAKEEGPGVFRFYQASMNARALDRFTLERRLRGALQRKEFLLHYQPQSDARTGEIVGMEALVRWNDPDQGMVSPGEFIPLAEETGLIVPLGEWVLREACRQNRAWQQAGLKAVRVSVNISARQFRQQDLFEIIARTLKDCELAPRHLELELTESLVMNDPDHVIETMARLKKLGVHLALDDFGTGYSSLVYLKRFPIDRIKIDRSFVRDITENHDDAAIALTVISMAHSLGLRVIAEGVETAAHLEYLREHECDEIQGYFLGRPMPAEDAARVLEVDRPLHQAKSG